MRIPKVAIITRTKDRPLFLKRAIRSVLEQTFADWGHVIVNDGGDPAVVDLLVEVEKEAYAGRVKVVHHPESRGMQNASNAGLAASDSVYAVIHDDDDSWYPDFLEKTVGFLDTEGPESLYQGVATQTTQILEEVTLSGEIEELKRRPYYPFAYVNLGDLRTRNIFAPIAFLYRRAVHEKIGLFRQEFDVLGDHDFNLRFVRQFEIGVIPTFHAYYHWRHMSHGNTVTRHREGHRRMLNRMKNAYYRDSLENPETAVGHLDGIEFPPPDEAGQIPFKLRTEEPVLPREMPDFRKEYDFDVLSLDVFDTVLKRRCHRPKDVFRFLEARAVRDLGLPDKPYAIARAEAESRAREVHGREVTLVEIHAELAGLCGLSEEERDELAALELEIEKEMLYADPRWLEFCKTCRKERIHVVFISDMYLSSATIRGLLADCGFTDAEVYVSCECGGSKHEGTLQLQVAERLGVDPARILHVGDNFHGDCLRSWQAGWQAFHWSQDFHYKPWHAQVDPYHHNDEDLLSPRIIGEVQRLALTDPVGGDDLYRKLGREVAGPLYLSFLLWVLRQAREDGVRKLLLVGRDGYYWDKALDLLARAGDPGVEYAYLHASRKVFNFASFETVDEAALDFLLTPNPSLRARDFIERTGLRSEKYLRHLKHVGFADPDEVLTNEMGGQFLESRYPRQLRDLFLLLRKELESMFSLDREGMLQALDDVGYDPDDCAFVDIGWNASCVRTVGRMLDLKPPKRVLGYYFGTWKEAEPADGRGEVKSFFMHFGEPQEHFLLTRESINWLETLHSAPFPTLMAYRKKGDRMEPQFAENLKNGFSLEQQGRMWEGAASLIKAATAFGLPLSGKYPGFNYINLVLNRLLREPSPAETAEWGGVLHSEGFGLEVYKRLVEPVSADMSGQDLLKAYRSSNWKRGFLATLTDAQRQFVLDRTAPPRPRTTEELQADLDYKTRQVDEVWGEKERYRWMYENTCEQLTFLRGEKDRLDERVETLSGSIQSIQNDKKVADQSIENLIGELEKHKAYIGQLQKEKNSLESEAAGLRGQRDELQGQKLALDEAVTRLEWEKSRLESEKNGLERRVAEMEEEKNGLKNQIADLEQQKAEMDERLEQIEQAVKKRGTVLKMLVSGKLPEPGA